MGQRCGGADRALENEKRRAGALPELFVFGRNQRIITEGIERGALKRRLVYAIANTTNICESET